MNREEAIVYVIKKIMEEKPDNLHIAVTALRGPQPNLTTGLVPCRWCGGEAGFHYATMLRDDDCYVECRICGEHSKVALSEDKARDVWNYSMGYRGK